MREKLKIIVSICVCMCIFTACSTESKFNEEQQQVLADYIAQTVLKHTEGYENKLVDVSSDFYLLTEEDASLYNQLGLCKIQMEEYEEALEAFQKGMEVDNCPCMQSLKFNEIVAYEYLGEFEKAKVLMESYLLTYPDDEEAKREQGFLKTR